MKVKFGEIGHPGQGIERQLLAQVSLNVIDHPIDPGIIFFVLVRLFVIRRHGPAAGLCQTVQDYDRLVSLDARKQSNNFDQSTHFLSLFT